MKSVSPMKTFAALALFSAVVPFVSAHAVQAQTGSRCSSNEFWYSKKSCCLPHGGPPEKPPTPPGNQCPPSGYYWGKSQGCCVPQHAPPPNGPPPQCPKNWTWSEAVQKCEPDSPPSSPTPPAHPSGYPGGGHHKRALVSRNGSLCPKGLDACPISGSLDGDYECVDTVVDLESCGGCASTGQGQDCTAIEGAWNVGCDAGVCAIYTCGEGFKRAHDAKSCIPL